MRTPFNLMDCDNITKNNINQFYKSGKEKRAMKALFNTSMSINGSCPRNETSTQQVVRYRRCDR
jgi:hypothetical protein